MLRLKEKESMKGYNSGFTTDKLYTNEDVYFNNIRHRIYLCKQFPVTFNTQVWVKLGKNISGLFRRKPKRSLWMEGHV